jgi:hypothetical protein
VHPRKYEKNNKVVGSETTCFRGRSVKILYLVVIFGQPRDVSSARLMALRMERRLLVGMNNRFTDG